MQQWQDQSQGCSFQNRSSVGCVGQKIGSLGEADSMNSPIYRLSSRAVQGWYEYREDGRSGTTWGVGALLQISLEDWAHKPAD